MLTDAPQSLLSSSRKRSGIVRAFRHRNYRLFFIGQLISLVGTWMQSVAQSWLVFRLTGSVTLLGVVAFCSQVPIFLLVLWGGAVADTKNRRRILMTTQATSMLLAALLAALTLTHRVEPWHILVLGVGLGIVNAFDIPARSSFVVEMVGKEDLMNAIALNSSMINGARIVGPAIAGLLVARVGEGWCFVLNALSFLAVLTSLLALRGLSGKPPRKAESTWASIREGCRYATRKAPVRALLLLLGLASLMGMPFSVLMPAFAETEFHRGAGGLGTLMGASGIGALAGALSLAQKGVLQGLGRWVLASSTLFGLALVGFALSRVYWLSVLLMVPVGASMMVQMAASNTLVQAMVPDHLRGRVMSVYSLMFLGLAPFGSLLAGAMAEQIGAPYTVAAGGVACILGGLTFGWFLPRLRGAARELVLSLQAVGGGPGDAVSGQRPAG